MTQVIRKYDFNFEKVTTMVFEDTYPGYVWIAFEPETSGECRLIKASTFNLNQIFFDITVPVDRINKIKVLTNNIVLAVSSDDYIGYLYSKTAPFSSSLALDKPVGVTQNAIDVVDFFIYFFFLLPGDATGENSQVLKIEQDGDFPTIIDLTETGNTITDASSMTIDDNDDIWIVTNTSPVKLVRVFDSGGGIYDFQTHTIA